MEANMILPTMKTEILSAVILLTLVIDPFGNVPLVNAMLSGVSPARRRLVIVRECAIAAAILALFMMFGKALLELMHLSETSLSIAGVLSFS
jgi:small neutral amino acid transporter SnatA (MarC family)